MTKILIADDSEQARSALKMTLTSQTGWSVSGEAENGRQAVLLAHKQEPDLVILDFSMPMLNGLEAAAEILRIAPMVPIVLYTSHWSSQLEREAAKIGIRKVISKSAPLDSFLSDLTEILQQCHPLTPQRDSSAKPAGNSEPISDH